MQVRFTCWLWLLHAALAWCASTAEAADQPAADRPAKVLLVGHLPDGHPPATHEYVAGLRIVEALLRDVPGIECRLVMGDEPFREGPTLIAQADAVVLFVREGGRWLHQDPQRFTALKKPAANGGGLAALHWALGCRDAQYIAGCVGLFGGCHGGPDRKYQVVQTPLSVGRHPVTRGLKDFEIRDEFYYRLKFPRPAAAIVPLLTARIDGNEETVAWAWQREDGGRSFGFTGLHFHENWRRAEYRRLVAQGVLWIAGRPIPEKGVSVDIDPVLLTLPAADRQPQ